MSPSERIDALVAGEPPEADEQRLARVIYELQAVRTPAPEALRSRVETLAATESSRRPTLLDRLSLRRAVLVLAPAVLLVAVGAAAVQGIVSATNGNDPAQPLARQTVDAFLEGSDSGAGRVAPPPLDATRARAPKAEAGTLLNQVGTPALPTTQRAQDYRVALRLRVDDVDALSEKTQEALRLTRRYGGYVVATRFRNPRTDEGDSTLELRVPIGRVQDALLAFSQLGSIVSQDTSIRDLQGQINSNTRVIRRLRDRMATLRASLLDPNLTEAERSRIETELAQLRSRVATLEQERRVLTREGRFAKISLALTTQQPPAKKDEAGRIERAFEDAGSVLAKEIAFGLYALIVASPFLLLAALAVFGARAGRRRADQRLLERA
jgi:Domain of unknown function (DUF4349)